MTACVLHDWSKHQIMTPLPMPQAPHCEGSNKPAPIASESAPDEPSARPACSECGRDVGVFSGAMVNYIKVHELLAPADIRSVV